MKFIKMEYDRNNTSYITQINELISAIKFESPSALRPNQKIVYEYILKTNIPGLLVYHGLGSGKTMTGVSIADLMVSRGYQVIFLAPKSLHDNFRNAVNNYKKRVKRSRRNNYDNKFHFISSNASNMIKQINKLILPDFSSDIKTQNDLRGYVMIIDEAHNFIGAVTNSATADTNAAQLYKLIMKTQKDFKLLLLTATPIVKDPYEAAICFNLLARTELFSTYYKDFYKYFVENNEIKNESKFTNRIVGLVSYYGSEKIKHLTPQQLPLEIIKVEMSQYQHKYYKTARKTEIDEQLRSAHYTEKVGALGKPQGAASSYRVKSRQLSNFAYPEYAAERWIKGVGEFKYKNYPDKLKIENLKWGKGLEMYSTKIQALLEKIQNHTKNKFVDYHITKKQTAGMGCGLIYSQFIDTGLFAIAKTLEAHGFIEIDSLDAATKNITEKKPAFAMIYGEVKPELRQQLVDIVNTEVNKHGEVIHLLLVSSTGAEGLNLKGIRHIHIFEPYWHVERLNQVIGRGVRLNSHMHLPEKERTVQPYLYISIEDESINKDDEEKSKIILSTDESLYHSALKTSKLINSFLDAIKTAAIDCNHHYKEPCKICMPTNRKLFMENLTTDMNEPDFCIQEKKITIDAQEIKVEGKSYLYDGKNIFEKSGERWTEIEPQHPDYMSIIKKVSALNIK